MQGAMAIAGSSESTPQSVGSAGTRRSLPVKSVQKMHAPHVAMVAPAITPVELACVAADESSNDQRIAVAILKGPASMAECEPSMGFDGAAMISAAQPAASTAEALGGLNIAAPAAA